MIVELTKEQISNLNNFLDRVEFKGRIEALALTEITLALKKAAAPKEGGNDGQSM